MQRCVWEEEYTLTVSRKTLKEKTTYYSQAKKKC